MKTILCLDFDGVICNSLEECMITSFVAYKKMFGNSVPIFKHVFIPQKIKKSFINYRYLVRPAWQYILLMKMLIGNNNINKNYFSHICNSIKPAERDFMTNIFFQTREAWVEIDKKYWLLKNPLYTDVRSCWSRLLCNYEIFIVTNKNTNAVIDILSFNKLKINIDNIYGSEQNRSKLEILRLIATTNQIKFSDMVFIDDNSDYIQEMLQTGFCSFLAGWGYEKYILNKCNVSPKNILNNFTDICDL